MGGVQIESLHPTDSGIPWTVTANSDISVVNGRL